MKPPSVTVRVNASRIYKLEDGSPAVRLQPGDIDPEALDYLRKHNPNGDVEMRVEITGQHNTGNKPITLVMPNGKKTEAAIVEPKLLIDNLMVSRSAIHHSAPRRVRDQINGAVTRARKFVFDSQASERLGETLRDSPELLADYGEFIRLPYPTTWIEFDVPAFSRGLGIGDEPNMVTDEKVGFLYDGNTVYVAAGTGDEVHFAFNRFRLHTATSFQSEQEICRILAISRMQIDEFFWGAQSYDGLNPAYRRALRQDHSMEFYIPDIPDGSFAPLIEGGGTGDMRNILGAAMLLMRPSLTEIISEKAPRKRPTSIRGPRAYAAHTVVTIKLTPQRLKSRIIKAAKEARAALRWHEVRAHYCHNELAKKSDCVKTLIDREPQKWIDAHVQGTTHPAFIDLMLVAHDWQEEEPDRWACRRCQGKRWWRAYPEGRGDASVGFVDKKYNVTV